MYAVVSDITPNRSLDERTGRRNAVRKQQGAETMTAEQFVAASIQQSTSTNSIVHLDSASRSTLAALSAECDDSVEIRGEEGVELVEYWGTDDDGAEWRIHARPDEN